MSLALVETLIESEKALIAALDADDVGAIERETQAFRNALEQLGPTNALADASALQPLAREALALADAARVRVAFLADATRRRIDMLATATGRGPAVTVYASNGRLRG
ncbi:MAG: hypothetical protein JOY99_02880 [Sphingomonadaceae bacterium]|nr:hypothetical protein [Sphingomonadaceae bacterium]